MRRFIRSDAIIFCISLSQRCYSFQVNDRLMTGKLNGGGMAATILCQQALPLSLSRHLFPFPHPHLSLAASFLFAPSSTGEPVHRLLQCFVNRLSPSPSLRHLFPFPHLHLSLAAFFSPHPRPESLFTG